MHGAGGGAPKRKSNGNHKHGFASRESIDARRLLRDVIRVAGGILFKL
jgi:hypothetical protein